MGEMMDGASKRGARPRGDAKQDTASNECRVSATRYGLKWQHVTTHLSGIPTAQRSSNRRAATDARQVEATNRRVRLNERLGGSVTVALPLEEAETMSKRIATERRGPMLWVLENLLSLSTERLSPLKRSV